MPRNLRRTGVPAVPRLYNLTSVSRINCATWRGRSSSRNASARRSAMTETVAIPTQPQARPPAGQFPLLGLDHLRFEVGNARQAAHYYSTAFGMTCIAYRGPEQGYRDVAEYVMVAGDARFVLAGPVRPGTDL